MLSSSVPCWLALASSLASLPLLVIFVVIFYLKFFSMTLAADDRVPVRSVDHLCGPVAFAVHRCNTEAFYAVV